MTEKPLLSSADPRLTVNVGGAYCGGEGEAVPELTIDSGHKPMAKRAGTNLGEKEPIGVQRGGGAVALPRKRAWR